MPVGASLPMAGLMNAVPQQSEKAPPDVAGYMGPVDGGFKCGNCTHFQQPNACGLVDGMIHPEGCCNLFQPGGAQGLVPGSQNANVPITPQV